MVPSLPKSLPVRPLTAGAEYLIVTAFPLMATLSVWPLLVSAKAKVQTAISAGLLVNNVFIRESLADSAAGVADNIGMGEIPVIETEQLRLRGHRLEDFRVRGDVQSDRW